MNYIFCDSVGSVSLGIISKRSFGTTCGSVDVMAFIMFNPS